MMIWEYFPTQHNNIDNCVSWDLLAIKRRVTTTTVRPPNIYVHSENIPDGRRGANAYYIY